MFKRLASAVLTAALTLLTFAPLRADAAGAHLIINQVYGGGGKSDTPFSHSFIELYNPTSEDISLDGYTVTYSSNRDTSEKDHAGSTMQPDGSAAIETLQLTGTVKASSSYLIRCAAEETSEAAVTLDEADLDWDRVIDNDKTVELILYDGQTRVDGLSTRDTDFRDIGEGGAPAADKVSKQKSIRRTNFADTDDNAADFSVIEWDALPADEAQKQQFIDTYRPRSGADGAWTEQLTPPEEEPSAPTQDFLYRAEGFENDGALPLDKIGSYVCGISNKDGGVAEIISYDAVNNKAWVVNGTTGLLDVLDLADVTCAVSEQMKAESFDVKALVEGRIDGFEYGDMTSVAVSSELGIAAATLQDTAYDKNGYVALFRTSGEFIALIEAGCQPDMLCFTPDGSKILVANEGEPREGIGEGITDPAGSVTIISLDAADPAASRAVTVGFEAFDSEREELIEQGVIFRIGAMPSEDFEPEYIACTDTRAYVALQEANAIAVLDLESGSFKGVYPLGYKDLSLEQNAVCLADEVMSYSPKTYSGAAAAYMPDGIALYTAGQKTYLLTANEGDSREWGKDAAEYVNEIKVTLTADDGSEAQKVRAIDASVCEGLPEGKTVLFGGRSFSVYEVSDTGLTQVYDSGSDFESKTAQYYPAYFNCSNDDNEYNSRTAKKGPEPESVTVGEADGRTYAFVALERIGGIMAYDITDPADIFYVNYINTRDFAEDPDNANPDKNPGFSLHSDIAPEGMYFIDAAVSPSGTPILLAAFEVSGTVAAYSVGERPDGHEFGGEYLSDADGHRQLCLKCGAEGQTAPHQGGEATCTRRAVCTVCGAAYGQTDPAAHTAQLENFKQASCTGEGYTGDTVCSACGLLLRAGSVTPRSEHEFVDGVCALCGQTQEQNDGQQSPSTADAALPLMLTPLLAVCAYAAVRLIRKRDEHRG